MLSWKESRLVLSFVRMVLAMHVWCSAVCIENVHISIV